MLFTSAQTNLPNCGFFIPILPALILMGTSLITLKSYPICFASPWTVALHALHYLEQLPHLLCLILNSSNNYPTCFASPWLAPLHALRCFETLTCISYLLSLTMNNFNYPTYLFWVTLKIYAIRFALHSTVTPDSYPQQFTSVLCRICYKFSLKFKYLRSFFFLFIDLTIVFIRFALSNSI